MLSVVLLITALGSTAAHADSIVLATPGCTTNCDVTAINGINIAGTTYNVTFGTTEDTTFAGSATNAQTAATDITNDLNSGSYDTVDGEACNFGVMGGATTYAAASTYGFCLDPANSWNLWTTPTASYLSTVAEYPGEYGFEWAEFSPVPTSAAEPGSLMLSLTGIGLLGLMVVMQKRKANALSSAN